MLGTNVDEKWQRARLIPVTGISGAEEQERRGTSVLLAVLGAVREFGKAVTTRIGAPRGSIETFIEVEFALGTHKVRPDGLIRVVGRGGKAWTALVEVKTGRNQLQAAQVESYLEVAKFRDYDAVLTISTQLADQPGGHPLQIDGRKLRRVALHHLSWSEIHTEAVVEHINHLVSDPNQAWLLAEFIRYLEEPKSGTLEFDDMGSGWPSVRDAVSDRTIRATDPSVAETVHRFGQLVSYAGMHLSQKLGVLVRPAVNRKDLDAAGSRLQNQITQLVETGRLAGSLIVPHAVAPIDIIGDLRSGKVSCSVTVPTPQQRKTAKGRITWVTSQLHSPPPDLLLSATAARTRNPGPSCLFDKVAEDPMVLLEGAKSDIRSVTLSLIRPAGTKRGRGRGTFIDSVIALAEEFYEQVVQEIRPAIPTAPKVKDEAETDATEDPVLGELLNEAPESPAVPSDGGHSGEAISPAAQAGYDNAFDNERPDAVVGTGTI